MSNDTPKLDATGSAAYGDLITEEMTRRNARVFLISYLLIYFAAPAVYVGIVQAALIDKLGASATIANLPLVGYKLGALAPLFLSWLVPHRLERNVVVWANVVTATLLSLVFLSLALPASSDFRITVVILQGLLQGFSSSISMVFQLQCLTRGTTSEGRISVLKQTFTLTPFSAVAGSLAAQWVLDPNFTFLEFPYDFAAIYLVAVPCIAGVAWVSTQYDLAPLADEPRKPLFGYLLGSVREFSRSRSLVLAWLGYWLWYIVLAIIPNISLLAREKLGQDPKNFAGYQNALLFGFKSVGGYGLGLLAMRYGLRMSALTSSALLCASVVWAWTVPGYGYLFAFGLIGAGQLGGTYFPNFAAVLSSPEAGTRNLALIQLAAPAAFFGPAVHGWLVDQSGFPASFIFGLAAAVLSMLMVTAIKDRARPDAA